MGVAKDDREETLSCRRDGRALVMKEINNMTKGCVVVKAANVDATKIVQSR